jgi:hypothetical protein
MKIILTLAFVFALSSFQSQVVNIGTTHFRNEQYLISFDKMMYPGYELAIENVHVREYLFNKLVSDSLYTGTVNFTKEEGQLYQSFITFPIYINMNEVQLEAEIEFTKDYKIANERYSELEESNLFQKYMNSQIPIKRLGSDNTVEEVIVNYEIDFQTNKIVQSEQILNKRPLNPNEINDVDRNIYTIAQIGEQVWISENLRTSKFNDGTSIPSLTMEQWQNSTAPGIINNGPDGYFYNFYTLVADKNVCPQGYHVPNEDDMEILYNTITPYDEELKITYNTVKSKRYSPWLTPITYPLGAITHLAMWSGAIALDASLLTVAVASDAAKFGFELVTSPILGWQGKKKQYKKNLNKALKNKYIDQFGNPLALNKGQDNYERLNLYPINKNDWSKFTVVNIEQTEESNKMVTPVFDGSGFRQNERSNFMGEVVSSQASIDSLKALHKDYEFKTKFKVFYNRNSITDWFVNSDYFSEYNGLFGAFNFGAYQVVEESTYPRNDQNIKVGNFNTKTSHLPVISLLLKEGDQTFANQYGFNLNHDNYLIFATNRRPEATRSTGITYVNYDYPGYFGVSRKNDDHELNIFGPMMRQTKSRGEMNPYLTQTRIRCVQD